ncbi:MAG: carboxypeptidase regulatory-like domain-containing protein, partial [Gemmatimonadales bacterium]
NGTWNWSTRIASFTFPGCTGTAPTTGSITGTVTDSGTSLAIAGATVAISGGASTTTLSSGVYTLSGLSPATYSVTASATGHSPSSATVTVTAGNTATQNFALTASGTTATVPGAVTNLSASPGPGKGVSLTWTAPSDNGSPISAYKVYRNTSGGVFTESDRIATSSAATKYKDTTTSAGTRYYYVIKAVNAVGDGPYSNTTPPVTPTK